MADPYELISFDGNNIGPSTDYRGILDDRFAWPVTGNVEMQSRRAIEPLVMSVTPGARTLTIGFALGSGGTTAATFRSNLVKWFDIGKNKSGPRYLVAYASDGTTQVRLPVYVVEWEIDALGFSFRAVLTMAQSYWEANSATTSSANPATVSNAGNVAVRPSIALTQSTHKTLRACTVSAASGTSLVAYPIRFALSDANATSTNVFVFINGISVPCNVQGGGGASSVVWALVDCAPDASDTYVDIIYGSGITNPLCGTLRDPDLFDTTGTVNDSWRYDLFSLTTNASHPGCWVPATTGNHGNSSIAYQLTSDGTTAVFAITSTGTRDYDSMALLTPSGSTALPLGGGESLTRTTASLDGTNAQAFVRTRSANADRWVSQWSTRANATVTSAINFSATALVVAAGLENDGATADPATLTLDQTGGIVRVTVTSPTVTVAAAANVDYYDGTYVVGNYTLTFDDCFAPDGTLTIDCGAKSITSSASGAIYNSPSFSDPAVWAALEPGSNTITDGVSASDTITHRDGYG